MVGRVVFSTAESGVVAMSSVVLASGLVDFMVVFDVCFGEVVGVIVVDVIVVVVVIVVLVVIVPVVVGVDDLVLVGDVVSKVVSMLFVDSLVDFGAC